MDSRCHPQSIAVLRSRADQLGIELNVGDHTKFDFSGGRVCGVVLQYPNTDGVVEDYTRLIEEAHKNGVSGVWAVWLCVCVCGGGGGDVWMDA